MGRGRPKAGLTLTDEERDALIRGARAAHSTQSFAIRCRIVLACAEGATNIEVATRLNVSPATVGKWRARFAPHGCRGSPTNRGPVGPPRSGPNRWTGWWRTPWTARRPRPAMVPGVDGRPAGLSASTVGRIWRRFDLRPHLQDGLTLAADPGFVDSVVALVGLYRHPRSRPWCSAPRPGRTGPRPAAARPRSGRSSSRPSRPTATSPTRLSSHPARPRSRPARTDRGRPPRRGGRPAAATTRRRVPTVSGGGGPGGARRPAGARDRRRPGAARRPGGPGLADPAPPLPPAPDPGRRGLGRRGPALVGPARRPTSGRCRAGPPGGGGTAVGGEPPTRWISTPEEMRQALARHHQRTSGASVSADRPAARDPSTRATGM